MIHFLMYLAVCIVIFFPASDSFIILYSEVSRWYVAKLLFGKNIAKVNEHEVTNFMCNFVPQIIFVMTIVNLVQRLINLGLLALFRMCGHGE